MMLGIALKRCLKCSVGHFWLSRHEEGRWRVRTRSGWAFRIGCTLRFRSCTRAKQWYISSFYWFHVPCIVYFGNEVRPIPVPVLRLRKYSKAYLCRSITVRCLLNVQQSNVCLSKKDNLMLLNRSWITKYFLGCQYQLDSSICGWSDSIWFYRTQLALLDF